MVTFGDFKWKHGSQVFNMGRRMGLCENCNAIVAMERFPARDVLARAKELHAEYAGKSLGFSERDEAKKLASEKGFAVLERVMELNRPPVCLVCGGNNVKPVNPHSPSSPMFSRLWKPLMCYVSAC